MSQIGKLLLLKGVKLPRPKQIYRFFYLFTPFKRLFVPTSQSPMSNLLRLFESFGKSNAKKWSQIRKLLLIKSVKSPNKKRKKSASFSLLAGFFVVGATIRIGQEILCLPYAVFLGNIYTGSKKYTPIHFHYIGQFSL